MILNNKSNSKMNFFIIILTLIGSLMLFLSDNPGYHDSSYHSSHHSYYHSSISHKMFNKKILGSSIVTNYIIYKDFEKTIQNNFETNINPDYITYDFYYYVNDMLYPYPEEHTYYLECIYYNNYKNNLNLTVFNVENMIINNNYNDIYSDYKKICHTYRKNPDLFSLNLIKFIFLMVCFLIFISCCCDCICHSDKYYLY